MTRSTIALALALGAAACASAPPAAAPPTAPAGPSFERKMAWILRLEDQRILRDAVPAPPPPPPAPAPARGKSKGLVVQPTPVPPSPDLLRLLADSEGRVRRRAALAVGRVGLADGVEPLLSLLGDSDPEVRQMAAFALGLLGDVRARDPLVNLLVDASPLAQGSAAEALGLIGDGAAAEPIARMLAKIVESGTLAQLPGTDAEVRRDAPAAAFRLGVNALVRLKASNQLLAVLLDSAGNPRIRWWPVAYALQKVEDPRALNALQSLAADEQPYTRAFAVKGLGALKDRASLPILAPLAMSGDRVVAVEAIRALGSIGDPAGAVALLKIIQERRADPALRLEAVRAAAGTGGAGANDIMLDLLSDPNPGIRAAALQSSAVLDPEGFVTVLSGLDVDPAWAVRASQASVLGTLRPELGLARLKSMLNDSDQRVIPSVLASLVKIGDQAAASTALERLRADDPGVRAAAARIVGELKPDGGASALAAGYDTGLRDTTYIARAAALNALARYGAADARPVLTRALTDMDWAVRTRAAALLKELDSSSDAGQQIRPAPTRLMPDAYQAARLVAPSVSTQVYIDTDRGTVQIELAVMDAPLTVDNFITLAKAGFFNGLTVHRVVPGFVVQMGDPRGDSEGGPGYTIRDELSELPYVRGTIGMALDWADTGGSQFFITEAPQPQLDAHYTVFGRVVAGMDVVTALQRDDVIRDVRVWDGPN